MSKVDQVSYLLLVFACGLCWGKLEDYEFQEVDPPVMQTKKFTLPADLIKNFARGFGGGANPIPLTEPRVNKHLYKSESVVTHRFTVYPRDPPMALCRCWLSKKFPYCDGAHRAHNERNKDNLGPAIISGSKKLSLYMNDTSAEDKK